MFLASWVLGAAGLFDRVIENDWTRLLMVSVDMGEKLEAVLRDTGLIVIDEDGAILT